MKTVIALLFAVFSLSLVMVFPAVGSEKRVFRSADKKKSFSAVLTGYDKVKDVLTVRRSAGRVQTFKMALLCEEDQAYVRENAAKLMAASSLWIDFDLYKGKIRTQRSNLVRTVTTPAGYKVSLANRAPHSFSDMTVDYTVFHRKAAENGPGSIAQTTGTLFISHLPSGKDADLKTKEVELVRYRRKASGGG